MPLYFQHRNLIERIEDLRYAARRAENPAKIRRERLTAKYTAEARRRRLLKHTAETWLERMMTKLAETRRERMMAKFAAKTRCGREMTELIGETRRKRMMAHTAEIWCERAMTQRAAGRARMVAKHAAHRLRLLRQYRRSDRERRNPRTHDSNCMWPAPAEGLHLSPLEARSGNQLRGAMFYFIAMRMSAARPFC